MGRNMFCDGKRDDGTKSAERRQINDEVFCFQRCAVGWYCTNRCCKEDGGSVREKTVKSSNVDVHKDWRCLALTVGCCCHFKEEIFACVQFVHCFIGRGGIRRQRAFALERCECGFLRFDNEHVCHGGSEYDDCNEYFCHCVCEGIEDAQCRYARHVRLPWCVKIRASQSCT